LLRTLAIRVGFVTTSTLLAEVWGPAYHAEQEYVRAYIRRLRAKLTRLGCGDLIESRPGLGYRLNVVHDT
jgi:DNA-binding response OmpR family regulator